MIIDIHTHTYPREISARVINKLSTEVNILNYTDGTVDSLKESQYKASIDYSVIQPVVTKPSQFADIIRIATDINKNTSESKLLSFAGIHPDCENISELISDISISGFKGIKLHPMFQGIPIDDKRYLNIIDKAAEQGLLIMIHGGGDINYPGLDNSDPVKVRKMLDYLECPPGIIIAHMGGWHCWESALEELNGYDIYLDTSSCLTPMLSHEGKEIEGPYRAPLSTAKFLDFVQCFGAEHILFGSDSPWGGQAESLQALRECGLPPEELNMIEGENAAKLLGIKKSEG